MSNVEKTELRILCKQGKSFDEIREIVDCSDATIKRYLKVFSPQDPQPDNSDSNYPEKADTSNSSINSNSSDSKWLDAEIAKLKKFERSTRDRWIDSERADKLIEENEAEFKAAIQNHVREAEIKHQIKYLTLKARYQRMFLGGEEDALKTKRYIKKLKSRLQKENQ